MPQIRHQIQSIAERSKLYSERHFRLIGMVAVITLPLSTFLEELVGNPSFNTLYIRLIAAVVALPLILYDRLPGWARDHFEWYWIAGVTYVLPFSFGLILTLNAALTEPGAVASPIWVYQYLVALFLFLQLINNGPLSASLWIASALLILAIASALDSPNVVALQDAWLYPLPVYLTALVVGSIANRNLEVVKAEQLRAAAAIGTNIAHELRTPLASIRILARAMRRFLPVLTEAYQHALDNRIPIAPISDRQLKQLSRAPEAIQAEVDYSNTIIDMLLANTSERPASKDRFEKFPISVAIEEAIARFPFNNSYERQLVRFTIRSNFTVFAPKPLVVHVFFNLIKNALYFVQKGGDPHVDLLAHEVAGHGKVEITDNGIGIPPNLQPRIFDRFFSSDPASQGAGIGLSFCKMVMESIGGDIRCESKAGEYTTFHLTFPRAR